MILNTFAGGIDPSSVCLSQNETCLRLGGYAGEDEITDGLIKKCEKTLFSVASPRYCAVLTEASYPSENSVDLGFGVIDSRDLYKNLFPCRLAYVFALTLGSGVDRALRRLSKTSEAEFYVFDALSSAYAEDICDECERLLKGEKATRPRYSPGYGDVALETQRPLLAYINAQRLTGITLSDACLMSPSKSITAIMGVKNEDT